MKRILKEFELSRIAAVDRPCQQGAVVTILKRDFSDDKREQLADKGKSIDTADWITKQFLALPMMFGDGDDDDGLDDFNTAFAENVENQLKSSIGSELYSYMDALRTTIAGILACSDIDPANRRAKVKESVDQFVASLEERYPIIADQLGKAVEKAYIEDLRKRFLTAKVTLLSQKLNKVIGGKASDYIDDFVYSDNPKFKGKSKEDRIRMALGAYYGG